jgi:hypothetical protein
MLNWILSTQNGTFGRNCWNHVTPLPPFKDLARCFIALQPLLKFLFALRVILLLFLLLLLRALQSMIEPWPSHTIARHWTRTCDFCLHFLTPTGFRSASSECNHLTADLPTRRVPSWSTSLLYRDSRFQVPAPKSSNFARSLYVFPSAAVVKSFATMKALYEVGSSAPRQWYSST